MQSIQRTTVLLSVVCLAAVFATDPAHGYAAQANTLAEDLNITVTAYSGQPFGVGIVTVTSRPQDKLSWREPDSVALQILGPDAFYPVVERTGFPTRQPDKSDELRIYFLFDTQRAKEIAVLGRSYALEAKNDPAKHRESLNRWWMRFSADASARQMQDQYPVQIEQYLTNMLARRLNLTTTDSSTPQYQYDADLERMAGILTGTEAVRLAMQKNALLGSSREEEATENLPKPVSPPPVRIPEPDNDVEVEAIAMAVPPESLYVRFTRYEDFVWFGGMIDQWGTELNSIATERALKYDIRRQVQDQLNILESEFAKHLSAAAVKEYAIIGSDTFLREGAGIGILFHAASSELLRAYLDGQRVERAAKGDGVTLSELQIDGQNQKASLLSSPDNRVRSIYVVSGDFHLVTTSQTIARRFLETCDDPATSLGASKEFRYARTVTPVSRNDTAFIYLSDQFFRTFVNPAFRVEMTRRASSESEIELVQLAIFAAKAEQRPHSTIDELITGGFLPSGFLKRADGSQLVLKDGKVIDSLRGARGAFLPVPDVSVEKVTKSELAGYEEFSRIYRRIWTWMDPATLAIQRQVVDKQERLVLDMRLYPYPRQEFGFLDFLSPRKNQKRLASISGTLLVAEANVFGIDPAIAGIVDIDLPVVIKDDQIDQTTVKPEDQPWFLGGSPATAFFNLFGVKSEELKNGEIAQFSNGNGDFFGRMRFGYTDGKFSVLSMNRSGLEPLVGKLALIDAERPAELRVHLGDIANSKIRRFLNAGIWTEANRLSKGNVDLLNRIVTQFHVPANDATSVVKEILRTIPVCPLGGDYQPNEHKTVTRGDTKTVINYESPFLKRLRGAEFELTTEGTTLISHVEVILDLP